MTNPTISYGHGYLTDCDDLTGWVETRNNLAVGNAVETVDAGDYFKIVGTSINVGDVDEYAYYTFDFTDNGLSDISSTSFPTFLYRYKTSESSMGFGARIDLLGTFDGGFETILPTSGTIPQFSTSWKAASGSITSGKTITGVRLWMDDYPDTYNGSSTSTVYYDFLLLCKGTFTFPNVGHGMEFRPPSKYAVIPIFGRVGDITQGGGSESAVVTCSCNLDVGDDWKRPQGTTPKTDYVKGQVFLENSHNSYKEPWQWLDTGEHQFKVTMETPVFRYVPTHSLDLLFREYRLSCGSNETYYERFGLNL